MLNDIGIEEFLDDARLRLVNYYVEQLKQNIVGEQVKFFGQEKETILQLLKWCYRTTHWHELIRLVDVIGRPMGILGYINERLQWGEYAMEACEKLHSHQDDENHEWFAVHDVAWAKARLGHYEEANEIWQKSLEIAKQHGYKNVEALALRNLSQMLVVQQHTSTEDLKLAVARLRRSIDLWGEIDEPEWKGHTQRVLGSILRLQGKLTESLEILRDAHQHLSSQGHIDGIINTLSDMAIVEHLLGNDDEALLLSDKSIETAITSLNPPAPAHAYALWQRAQLEAMLHHPRELVTKWAREAVQLYEASVADFWAGLARHWLENYLLGAIDSPPDPT